MASVALRGVTKVFSDDKRAVADLNLEIEDGELMVLVGPSGCGKTTTLRMIAGLEDPTSGEIVIGGQPVDGLDPRQRDVAMVFQNYALYPHMSVFDNLAFPLRAHGVPREEVKTRVERTAALLNMHALLRRKPRSLSGGERQRVAMGRALVREPRVFLMDEPLSNLDAHLRAELRAEIAQLQRELGVTTVYVTHDQVEAMTMGTRIAVLRDGVLQQTGAPQALYDEPSNLFVATFLGSPTMNLLRGRIERDDGTLQCVIGTQRIRLPRAGGYSTGLAGYVGAEVVVGIRPEEFREQADGMTDGSRLQGRVRHVEQLGAELMAHLLLDADAIVAHVAASDREPQTAGVHPPAAKWATVTARFDAHANVSPGDVVDTVIRSELLHFFDPATNRAIR